MSSNPYQAPEVGLEAEAPDRIQFADFSTQELKKLYHHSRTIRVLVILWFLGAFFIGTIITFTLVAASEDGLPIGLASLVIWFPLLIFQAVAIYGTMKRTRWGRIFGIVLCCFMLIGFPLGTFIGILGLVAIWQGKVLYGTGRLEFLPLREEYKYRKKNKID